MGIQISEVNAIKTTMEEAEQTLHREKQMWNILKLLDTFSRVYGQLVDSVHCAVKCNGPHVGHTSN